MNPLSESSRELIDKYLLGRLTIEEEKLFDKELENQDFQAALNEQQDLQIAMTAHGREVLIKKMNSWEEKSQKTNRFTRRNIWAYSAIAAAIALLFLVFTLRDTGSNLSNEELFAANFEVFPNIVNPTVREGNAPTGAKEKAFSLYENADFSGAYDMFLALPDTAKDNKIDFYTAISALGAEKPQEAIQILKEINQNPAARFYKEAAWYLALAHLKIDDTEGAIEYSTWVTEHLPHPYESEAKKIINQLK